LIPTRIERLLRALGLLGLAGAFAVALDSPWAVIVGWGQGRLAGMVHLATLGGVVSLAYALQNGLWRRLYGERAPWPPLLWAAAALHAAGVALLAWGFLWPDPRVAVWGGHYLVPTGIVLALAHGIVAAWRRQGQGAQRAPRRLAAHLPMVGLVVAMSLGALLVMEAHDPRWGLYTPETILAHLLAAGFLFVVPLLLLPGALAAAQAQLAAPGSAAPSAASPAPALPAGVAALLRWYVAQAVGAGGVLLVVLGQWRGPARLLPLGLAMLGALLVWLGLPEGGRLRARAPGAGGLRPFAATLFPLAGRLATGVLLFYAALRVARGPGPEEGYWLAKVGVLLFLAAMALPELLVLSGGGAGSAETVPPGRPGALRLALWLGGTALLLAGQLWALPQVVRLGALLWLATLVALGWQAAGLRGR
jgi:hypothetical protein